MLLRSLLLTLMDSVSATKYLLGTRYRPKVILNVHSSKKLDVIQMPK